MRALRGEDYPRLHRTGKVPALGTRYMHETTWKRT